MQIEAIETATAEPSRAAFTVDPRALADAAGFLAKRVIERRNTIPILSRVMIEADAAGAVILSGTDQDILARVTVPADVETPGTVCVDAAALSDALAKVRKGGADAVRIADNGARRVTVNAGRAAFKLAALPADDFPVTVAPIADEALSAFTVPAARFLSDLAALAPCISTEEARYYLNGIAMQVRDLGGRERLAMVATDGSNIGAASRPIPAGAERLPDSIVPRKTVATIRHAAKLVPDCEAVAVEVEGNRARFALGPVVIESKLIDGTFPQWERAFEGLAPTGETEAPLFPELIPGTPLAAMAKLGKGAAIEWQDATDGKFGTVPGDDGLIFAALNLRADIAEPLKGYRYSHEQGDYAASEYLTGLAVKRHGAIPHDWNVHLVTDAGGYQGLTVGKTEYIAGHYVETPNWETLAIERVYIEGRSEYLEGAYSVVMPRERAERRSDVRLEIDGDSTVYPIATNSGGKIHLSADQVRNIAGDSVFETLALTIAGKVVYVLAWLFAQGDSRFLTVRSDGRCFAGKDRDKAQYLSREQVEAALRGEEVAEAVEICPPEAAGSDCGPCAVSEAPEAPEALCEAVSGPDEPTGEVEQLPADPVADLAERVAALEARLEALAVETGPVAENTNNSSPEFIAAPSGEVARPARTAAHERAIRRAWAERKARRGAQGGMAIHMRRIEALEMELRLALNEQALDKQAIGESYARAEQFARRGNQHATRRRAGAARARRMISAARQSATFQRQRADVLAAQLDKLRADMADPIQPERASDLARLVRERDEARNAAAATSARNASLQSALNTLGDKLEEMAVKVTLAERAARGAPPIAV